jgi:hypothetical protein
MVARETDSSDSGEGEVAAWCEHGKLLFAFNQHTK